MTKHSFFCPLHLANTCPKHPMGNENYYGHTDIEHLEKGSAMIFCGPESFFQLAAFFSPETKPEVVRICVPFFSNNQMLLSCPPTSRALQIF